MFKLKEAKITFIFFGKLSKQGEKNKKKQNTSLKNPLNVQSIGGLNDPFVSVGMTSSSSISFPSKGLWSTRDLNLGVW